MKNAGGAPGIHDARRTPGSCVALRGGFFFSFLPLRSELLFPERCCLGSVFFVVIVWASAMFLFFVLFRGERLIFCFCFRFVIFLDYLRFVC